MKRPVLLLLLLIPTLTQIQAQEIPLEVSASECHGAFYLLESLRGNPNGSTFLREKFWAHYGRAPELVDAVREYKQLTDSWNGATLRAEDGSPLSLPNLLELLAVDQPSNFPRSAQFILSADDFQRFSRLHGRFRGLYSAWIWTPRQRIVEERIAGYRQGFERAETGRRLRQAAEFYGIPFPEQIPFRLALVPLPMVKKDRATLSAHNNHLLQVLELPDEAPESYGYGQTFHEFCHFFWNSRPPDRQRELKRIFLEEAGAPAWQLLDEGLATAMGNIWFTTVAGLGPLPAPAYADTYIDGYARELAALLDQGHPLDSPEFAHKAASLFTVRFADAATDPGLVFRQVLLLSDSPETRLPSFLEGMGQAGGGRLRAISTEPVEAGLEPFRNQAEVTTVFLITPAARPLLAKYGLDPGSVPPEGVYCRRLEGRWLIVCVTATLEKQRQLWLTLVHSAKLNDSAGSF